MTIRDTASETTRVSEELTRAEVDAVMQVTPIDAPMGPFHALRFRNFRLFFYGQLISVAGTWMQTVAQNWLVYERTHSTVWLGIVSGASALPFVGFAIWGGQLADRAPRRVILIWTQTLAMVLAFIIALLASHLSPIPLQAWHIAVIAALGGVVNAFNMPAQQAFVTDMVDDRRALGNAIALNSLRFNMARVLGPVLAGIVLVRSSAAACFFLNGLSFVAVIISLLMMRLPAFVKRTGRPPISEGFRYILKTHSVLRIIVLIGVASLTIWPLSTLYPAFADMFHRGKEGYGTMMAANGLGAALAGLFLARSSRISRKTQIYGGSALFCFSLLLLAAANSYDLALGCIVLGGFAMILFGISAQTKVQEEVPDALRGRVLAVYTLVFNGFFSLGGFENGKLAHSLSVQQAAGVNAVICLAVTAALFVWSLTDRERPPTD